MFFSPRKNTEEVTAEEKFNELVHSLASFRGHNLDDAATATANTPPLVEVIAVVGVEELDLQKKYAKMQVSNQCFLFLKKYHIIVTS